MTRNLFIQVFFTCSLVLEALTLAHNPSPTSQNSKASSKNLGRLSNCLIINGIQSPPRSFFATIKTGSTLCGATVISRRFVITAASCFEPLFFFKPDTVTVEIGDYTDPDSNRTSYQIVDFFISPDYGSSEFRDNSISLVKTETAIANWTEMALPVCQFEIPWDERCDTPLAACGMGLIDRLLHFNVLPEHLQEVMFRQTKFEAVSENEIVFCKNHTICTIPMVDGGSICNMDEGGPLYKLSSDRLQQPICLYGVATYHTTLDPTNEYEICDSGSYFANVVF